MGLPLLSLPGSHWVGALVVLAVGSPFGVCHKEVKAQRSAAVLDAGLWDPGCSTAEALWSHGGGKEGLEEGCRGGWHGVTSLWHRKESGVGQKASANNGVHCFPDLRAIGYEAWLGMAHHKTVISWFESIPITRLLIKKNVTAVNNDCNPLFSRQSHCIYLV